MSKKKKGPVEARNKVREQMLLNMSESDYMDGASQWRRKFGRNHDQQAPLIPYEGGEYPRPTSASVDGEFDRAWRIGDRCRGRMLGRKSSDTHVNIETEPEA